MKHEELVDYAARIDIHDLNVSNFRSFVDNAREIFMPLGTIVGVNWRTGLNSRSKGWYSEGKRPFWNQDVHGRQDEKSVKTTDFDVRKSYRNRLFLFVDFKDYPYECFGYDDNIPLRFAFDPGKALYIAEQSHNGTKEFPSEMLFFRK